MSIEKKTAKAILQKAIKITVGDQTYNVSPPSLATLILVSEEISNIPAIKIDTDNIALESIAKASYAVNMCNAIAIMILGAKKIQEGLKRVPFWPIIRRNEASAKDVLAKEILEELQPKEVSELFGKLLKTMQVDFFLGTMISLTEINLLKTKTTASGQ